MRLVAFAGFKSAGKTSAAEALCRHGWQAWSFAGALKDAVAALFGWPRHLLEGDSVDSRAFRETVDPWWAARLGIVELTPRLALQRIGTDVFRQHFHPDIWLAGIERRLHEHADQAGAPDVVLADARFRNELALVRRYGGQVIRIRRGPDPDWMATLGDDRTRPGVHVSETDWIGTPLDGIVENDGTLAELQAKVVDLLVTLPPWIVSEAGPLSVLVR